MAIYGPSDAELVLDTTLVKIRDGQVVLSSGGMPVLTAVNREKGMVAVAAYDFTDIGEFCQDHPYVDKLFTSLLGEDRSVSWQNTCMTAETAIIWKCRV